MKSGQLGKYLHSSFNMKSKKNTKEKRKLSSGQQENDREPSSKVNENMTGNSILDVDFVLELKTLCRYTFGINI